MDWRPECMERGVWYQVEHVGLPHDHWWSRGWYEGAYLIDGEEYLVGWFKRKSDAYRQVANDLCSQLQVCRRRGKK